MSADFESNHTTWALITGATEGIGRAFCLELASRGINVVLVARTAAHLNELCTYVQETFAVRAECKSTDLADMSSLHELVGFLKTKNIIIDILINNASRQSWGEFAELKEEEVKGTLQLNLVSPFILTLFFAKTLIPRNRSGTLINVCSQSAYQPVPYLGCYAATKAALLSFSLALHQELKETSRIYVQTLVPDFTKSKSSSENLDLAKALGLSRPKDPEAIVKKSLAAIPLRAPLVTNIRFLYFHQILMAVLPRRILLKLLGSKLRVSKRYSE